MSRPVAPDGPVSGMSAPSLIGGFGAAVDAATDGAGDAVPPAVPPPQATATMLAIARIVPSVLRMLGSLLFWFATRGGLTPLAHLRIARATHASGPSPRRCVGANRRRRRPSASCTSPAGTGN